MNNQSHTDWSRAVPESEEISGKDALPGVPDFWAHCESMILDSVLMSVTKSEKPLDYIARL
eukprot:COSAG02_NODE_66350_length_255_cov_1.301282_1_plen_60_part_01